MSVVPPLLPHVYDRPMRPEWELPTAGRFLLLAPPDNFAGTQLLINGQRIEAVVRVSWLLEVGKAGVLAAATVVRQFYDATGCSEVITAYEIVPEGAVTTVGQAKKVRESVTFEPYAL